MLLVVVGVAAVISRVSVNGSGGGGHRAAVSRAVMVTHGLAIVATRRGNYGVAGLPWVVCRLLSPYSPVPATPIPSSLFPSHAHTFRPHPCTFLDPPAPRISAPIIFLPIPGQSVA